MDRLEKIYEFAVKWYYIYRNEFDFYAIFDTLDFPGDADNVGFIMDSGERYAKYVGDKGDPYDSDVLKEIVDEITDVDLLGSGIYSLWRYYNHWAMSPCTEEHKKWFEIALKKLKKVSRPKGKLVFSKRTTTTFGAVGDKSGELISILEDGMVITKEFVIGVEEAKSAEISHLPTEVVGKISDAIDRYSNELSQIPRRLNNGSLDGIYQKFHFGSKKITALNISRTERSVIDKCESEDVKMNMIYENMVLDVYEEIKNILDNTEKYDG